LKTNAPPGDEIIKSSGQFVQVVKVDPEQSPNHPMLRPGVPDYIRKYYETNEVNTFTFSRPYKKQKSGNEFLDLWTQKTVLLTKET
jgi:dedicator of cytokinesis protein 3